MSSFDVMIINEITTCDDVGQCDDDDDNDHEDNDHKQGEDNDDHVVFCTVTLFLVLKFLKELFFKTDCFSTTFAFSLFSAALAALYLPLVAVTDFNSRKIAILD